MKPVSWPDPFQNPLCIHISYNLWVLHASHIRFQFVSLYFPVCSFTFCTFFLFFFRFLVRQNHSSSPAVSHTLNSCLLIILASPPAFVQCSWLHLLLFKEQLFPMKCTLLLCLFLRTPPNVFFLFVFLPAQGCLSFRTSYPPTFASFALQISSSWASEKSLRRPSFPIYLSISF